MPHQISLLLGLRYHEISGIEVKSSARNILGYT
jgi:hypothetical protein